MAYSLKANLSFGFHSSIRILSLLQVFNNASLDLNILTVHKIEHRVHFI